MLHIAFDKLSAGSAQQMAARGLEVVLLQGARNPDELLYGDEFRAFATAHPGFRYLPCFSRELPADGSLHAHPDVRHGYVQNALAELAPDPASPTCAATRTWLMPASRRSRRPACRSRRSAARNTSAANEGHPVKDA